MKQLTLEQHRARIENINSAEENNKKYLYRHRIYDYLPGQAVYASMFVNEEKYLVVSNFQKTDYELKLAEPWTDRRTGTAADAYTVKPGRILFLKK